MTGSVSLSSWSYEQFKIQHPVINQSISSGFLWGFGDFVAQRLEARMKSPQSSVSYHYARTLRMAFFGGCIWSPATYYWFKMLEDSFPGEGVLVAIQRMAADQLLYAPLVIFLLFIIIGLLEGLSVDSCLSKLYGSYWVTLQRNWMLWPAVQLINQSIVPFEYRMLVANLVSVPWTAYLAYKAALLPQITSTGGFEMVQPEKRLNPDEGLELMEVKPSI